jgi:hypothetical protein
MEQDTAPEMAARYRERIGRLSPAERLAQALRLSQGVRALAEAGLRWRFPEASEAELRWRLAELLYGRAIAERAYGPGPVER